MTQVHKNRLLIEALSKLLKSHMKSSAIRQGSSSTFLYKKYTSCK